MSLLAEEIIEEWLRRQGYFTIRGIKIGVNEIDILAIKFYSNGIIEKRHIEVQVSFRPVSYISKVPKELQKTGIAPNSSKYRSEIDLQKGVDEWIKKKYEHPNKIKIMQTLCCGTWSRELVINIVHCKEELRLIENRNIVIHEFQNILDDINNPDHPIRSSHGADFIDLLSMKN